MRSGNLLTLRQIADELSNRLIRLWLRDENGERPFERAQDRSAFASLRRDKQSQDRDRHLCLFHEYFHGDTGAGLGASHQTGWTGVIADLIRRRHGEVPSVGDVLRILASQIQE